MNIEWRDLRPWNGSQNAAFEELCCQLANAEPPAPDAVFKRVAAPDAGTECYWTSPNGDEFGWQAKFLQQSLDDVQWRQIDGSVATALEKHTRLIQYTVWLPLDLADPRLSGRQYAQDKWNEHVAKWSKMASDRKMAVEFRYWGEHEIWQKLSLAENSGRFFFWFHGQYLSREWFTDQVEVAVANVGVRYSRELNIHLLIAGLFEGLGRTQGFYVGLKNLAGRIAREARSARVSGLSSPSMCGYEQLLLDSERLVALLQGSDQDELRPLPLKRMAELATTVSTSSWAYQKSAEKDLEETESPTTDEELARRSLIGSLQYHLAMLRAALNELISFAESSKAQLANTPALLLIGDAGTGKTHLMCDAARQRASAGQPTVLLLGTHFTDAPPLPQIVNLLSLSCSVDVFLGALSVASETSGGRALILIDAINEGDGKALWYKHLAGMLVVLSRFPRVAVALSVRKSYLITIIPDELIGRSLILEEHRGFSDLEFDAAREFFRFYAIELPSVPLLVPEFQNPLFLKTLCKGLHEQGQTRIPRGVRGITAVFGLFLSAVNAKLARPEDVGFDRKQRIVQMTVDRVAERMATERRPWLSRKTAQEVVDDCLPPRSYEDSLFRHMVSEGVLSEDMHWQADSESVEVIQFAYERLSDHYIAKHLLQKHLDQSSPEGSFEPNQPLGALIADERSCMMNAGIVGALMIQVPEMINREVVSLAPKCAGFETIRRTFIESLVWRDPRAVGDDTKSFVRTGILTDPQVSGEFIDAVLTLAVIPEHPYNADFLHLLLLPLTLPRRDAGWSIWLHHEYGNQRAVDRLMSWAWEQGGSPHWPTEVIRLASTAIAWFLTSSHRYLRDRATKALVSLFSGRTASLIHLLHGFGNVNDPYVLQRLFAVAYGCAMRATSDEDLEILARAVYATVFEAGTPPPDILLRDYARGIIELALSRRTSMAVDMNKVRPPYRSDWPTAIPTEDSLSHYGKWEEGMSDAEWARVHLFHSVMGFEDFSRYVIAPRFDYWSRRRLGTPAPPTLDDIYGRFVDSLTSRQQAALARWLSATTPRVVLDTPDEPESEHSEDASAVPDETYQEEIRHRDAFLRSLGKQKRQKFEEEILPRLQNSMFARDQERFDVSLARRWILQKVFNLGWTTERFGVFDAAVNRYPPDTRQANKPERIGKKYQWIACHELLARASDNFVFLGNGWQGKSEIFQGPWQISARDIDPSFLSKGTQAGQWRGGQATWWFPCKYDAWDVDGDPTMWLRSGNDLPDPATFICVRDPQEDRRWLTLDLYASWEEPTPAGEEQFERLRRHMFYIMRAYIVRRSASDNLFAWASQQNLVGRRLPESGDLHGVFFGELYWSPAYAAATSADQGYEDWVHPAQETLPEEVVVPTDTYNWGGGDYDCSIDDSINIRLPSRWLAERMQLRWSGREGQFCDEQGKTVALDPSVKSSGPGALVIRADALRDALKEDDCDLLWTVVGEKNLMGGDMGPRDWKGRLEISGAYRFRDGNLEGGLRATFHGPNE